MSPSDRVGDRALGAVICAVMEAGWIGSIPFGEHHRYDLIIDQGGTLLRAQVKNGRLRNGVVLFNGYSAHGGPYRPDEIDVFAVHCHELRQCYLVPQLVVPNGSKGYLRVQPTRNNQIQGVQLAEQYVFPSS